MKPWQKKSWCMLPRRPDAEFVCRMEDVLSVYKRPFDPLHPVVGMDEATKQLIAETRRPESPAPGRAARFDYEYRRCGVANLFMLFAPLLGWRTVKVTARKTKRDWAHLMRELVDVHFARAERITVVLDNLNTHRLSSLYETFAPAEAKRIADKLELHFTPKHASWLNVAESELACLTAQCMDRRIDDMAWLQREVTAWHMRRNRYAKAMRWRFTVEDARIKLDRLYPSI